MHEPFDALERGGVVGSDGGGHCSRRRTRHGAIYCGFDAETLPPQGWRRSERQQQLVTTAAARPGRSTTRIARAFWAPVVWLMGINPSWQSRLVGGVGVVVEPVDGIDRDCVRR
jgi:hypothetical protein